MSKRRKLIANTKLELATGKTRSANARELTPQDKAVRRAKLKYLEAEEEAQEALRQEVVDGNTAITEQAADLHQENMDHVTSESDRVIEAVKIMIDPPAKRARIAEAASSSDTGGGLNGFLTPEELGKVDKSDWKEKKDEKKEKDDTDEKDSRET